MFSGIIEAIGTVENVESSESDSRLLVNTGNLKTGALNTGDSIALNGVCLTVTAYQQSVITFDVSAETLSCTTLADLTRGTRVNLEQALMISDRLNGHIVTGHVDAIATITDRRTDGRSERFVIQYPDALHRYISRKGSICIDGVSLTINDKKDSTLEVNIIPHTLENTIFSDYTTGTRVNMEVDIIARYLESLVQPA